MTDELDAEIDRLYGLPLEQFTPARDELARRLRTEGKRDSADRVKRLRKPTIAAWALNQARRAEPAAVEQLIAAGNRLREAQERLLAAGERGGLREAAAEERRLIEELGRAGERQLESGGHAASAATQSKLWSTLRAVAGDPEARELLASGRLARDYTISDLGLGFATPTGTAPPAAKKRDGAKARKARGIEQRLERAREKQLEADQKRADAEKRADAAQREAARAADALERARARSKQEAEQIADLEGILRELRSEP
jgi:hypothetical protein